MISLNDVNTEAMSTLIEKAPRYAKGEYRALIENTIGAIHQIPHIFKRTDTSQRRIDLKDIEAYFGRSSASAFDPGQNIAGRFRAHRDNPKRRHEWGMIIARTTIQNTLRMEKFGISVIDNLKERSGLCISNKTSYSKGAVGENEPGLLYMTFRITLNSVDPDPADQMSIKQIDEMVKSVISEKSFPANEKTHIADAARIAFEAANEVRFIGKKSVSLYDPEDKVFIDSDIKRIR